MATIRLLSGLTPPNRYNPVYCNVSVVVDGVTDGTEFVVNDNNIMMMFLSSRCEVLSCRVVRAAVRDVIGLLALWWTQPDVGGGGVVIWHPVLGSPLSFVSGGHIIWGELCVDSLLHSGDCIGTVK